MLDVNNKTHNLIVLDSLKIDGTNIKIKLSDSIQKNETKSVMINGYDTMINKSRNTFKIFYHFADQSDTNRSVVRQGYLKPRTGNPGFRFVLKNK